MVIFYAAAAVAVAATLLVVLSRNAIHALLYFILSLCAVAVVFYVLGAPWIAVLEVIVYAGAIMVLFVFVVMMLEARELEEEASARRRFRFWSGPAVLSLVVLAELVYASTGMRGASGTVTVTSPGETGRALFDVYFLGVELVSVLLLSGLVGAYHLGRRENGVPEATGAKEVSHDVGTH